MSQTINDRLAAAGIELPDAPVAVGSYAGYVKQGNLVYVSGQLPKDGKNMQIGLLGSKVSLSEGQEAAKRCAINILSQMKSACDGDLERIARCVRLGGFVASAVDFYDQHQVINGASDFIRDMLGEARGVHARAAVGVTALPLNASVEIEAMFAIRD